jgi:hypothetical protein
MARKLNLSLKGQHALEVTRIAIGNENLVYCADRKQEIFLPAR